MNEGQMDQSTLLFMCGLYNLAFAIFHIFFWKLFNWRRDLRKNHPANRAIIQILNIRLIYVFILFGLVYLLYPEDLINTKLGFFIMLGILGFWIGRTIEQFIFLRIKSRLVTVLTIIFVIGIVLHLIPLLLSE